MGLARNSANEAIHKATPWAAVEGSDIRPHRSRSQPALLHRVNQDRAGEGFPLDQHDRASAWICQLDTEIKPASACAEADVVEGT